MFVDVDISVALLDVKYELKINEQKYKLIDC
jgi:hypothetical protein